jgi:methylthioribulose-1-phosphate dehydratase
MSPTPSALDRQREEASALCRVIAMIHQRGWCDGTGGNFSTVLSGAPLELLMAPSGVDKGALAPDDLIVVDGEGRVIRGDGKASAETLLHLAIIAATNAGAVLHTHSQAATLLSRLPLLGRERLGGGGQGSSVEAELIGHLQLGGLEMLKGLEGIRSHAHTITLPILANCQDMRRLEQATRPHLATAPYGVLIAGHGLYAWGDSLPQAKRHLEILEFLLEQHWRQIILEAMLAKGGRSA